jgi:hypothetical protein
MRTIIQNEVRMFEPISLEKAIIVARKGEAHVEAVKRKILDSIKWGYAQCSPNFSRCRSGETHIGDVWRQHSPNFRETFGGRVGRWDP